MKKQIILIVDDEEINIILLTAILNQNDYRIFSFTDGEQTLKEVKDIRPDLILLDVMMPSINGFEVCRRLKQDEDTKMIPVLMVTALREKEHKVKAMEVGADDFISKPVDKTEIIVRVKSLLRIKSYHDELLNSYRIIAEKNEKLNQLKKAKEGLTHMIVHDLRNPLTAMTMQLDLISMQQSNLTAIQIEKIGNCLKSCRDLNDMIQGLLDIYKIEEGACMLKKADTSIEELINQVLQDFTVKAAPRGILLSLADIANVPSVNVDRIIVKRIISNLLNNAIRHTPDHGEIEISVKADSEKGSICISVKDSGNGIPSEQHQKIFEKFYQLHTEKAGFLAGESGLGLAFCKMAAEAHGGQIWVESNGPGTGSAFRFTLPV